jgi:hypothetical protein
MGTNIMKIWHIAMVCHEANRQHCRNNGDFTQAYWDEAPEWQKDSAYEGVKFALANPGAPDSSMHDAWMASKIADGWVYGEIKDAEAKTHPCLVPFDQLPLHQQQKDRLFMAIVKALS